MKTGFSPYSGEISNPHKKLRVATYAPSFPLDMWREIVLKCVFSHSIPGVVLTPLSLVSRDWNVLCKSLIVPVCEKVSLDNIFCISYESDEKNLNNHQQQIADKIYNVIGAMDDDGMPEGCKFIRHLPNLFLQCLETQGSQLKSFTMRDVLTLEQWNHILEHASNLQHLMAGWPDDDIFKLIGQQTQLKSLFTHTTAALDEGINYLCDLPLLETLKIWETGNHKTNMISKLTALRDLVLMGMSDDPIEQISTLTRLNKLHISAYSPASWNSIENLKNIEHLIFENVGEPPDEVNDNALASICQLDRLKHLELACCNFTKNGFQLLNQLTNLHTIGLTCTSPISLEDISNLTKLKRLKLLGQGVKDLSHITAFNSLTKLKLDVFADGNMLLPLVDLKNLTSLSIKSDTSNVFLHISKLTQVQVLSIQGYHRAFDYNIAMLLCLKKLRKLIFLHSKFTEIGNEVLKRIADTLHMQKTLNAHGWIVYETVSTTNQ